MESLGIQSGSFAFSMMNALSKWGIEREGKDIRRLRGQQKKKKIREERRPYSEKEI